MMNRNLRRIVMLVVLSVLGLVAFAFTYRVIAGEVRGGSSAGALAGY